MTDNNMDTPIYGNEMSWDIDELENPTEEDIVISEEDVIDPAQVDLSAPAGVNIEDPIHSYLKELEDTPILTAEEEAELSKRVEAGDEEAKGKMTEASLRLVVGLAKRYANRGVAFSDLVQEGNLGLMNAVEMFDDQKGCSFRTYACWWIKQALDQAIEEQTESSQLSAHVLNSINEQQQVIKQLTRDLGRTPTDEEIASKMDVSVDTVREITKMSQNAEDLSKSDDEEEEAQSEEEEPEVEVVDEDESESEDTGEAAEEQSPLKEQMEAALTSLTEQEQQVVRMRYGLNHELPRSPEEVGQKLGLSREEVQEIEASAMQKLGSQDQSSNFQGYVDEN